ncbi:hypothetical protein AURDEDRAFT_153718 [Auricularia subglabra TFB-10046 SS5]|nr:hypothetical protein AURDEDRAFT_153718 [Auricularia subglabra TFB-10046 SS5]
MATTALDFPEAANQGSITYRIPPEVLANCFAFLRLVDCFRASFVSRYWRAVALSTPGLWARVSMDCSDAEDLAGLNMILARAGQVPAHLKLWPETAYYPAPAPALAPGTILRPHTHRTKCLEWWSCDLDGRAIGAAPFLEHLTVHGRLDIPEDFLGGRAARLRSLSFHDGVLPRTCAALSTLVVLDVRYLDKFLAPPPSLETLFDLCPILESLTLAGLRAAYSNALPRGRAPQTLRALKLTTRDDDYDLTQHYFAWQAPNLRYVTLSMGEAQSGTYPIPQALIAGATALTVMSYTLGARTPFGTFVLAEYPAAEACEYTVSIPGAEVSCVVSHIMAARASLQAVHTVRLSLNALAPCLDLIASLPALRHLTIFIGWNLAHEHVFAPDIPALACLARLLPSLDSLVLRLGTCIATPGSERISAADARILLDVLGPLGPLALPEIQIQGFAAQDLLGVEMPVGGPRLRFDTTALDVLELPSELPTPCCAAALHDYRVGRSSYMRKHRERLQRPTEWVSGL